MQEMTLAQRLIVWAGRLSQREDVVVRRQTSPRQGYGVKWWAGRLPDDMLAFYQEINGWEFRYDLDSEQEWRGFRFAALARDGHNTIDTLTERYAIPH